VILLDTSVIVGWLDKTHPNHRACVEAIEDWAQREQLAVSSVTYGELAAGGRTREAVEEDLRDFEKISLDVGDAWRAGRAFRQYRSSKEDKPVLPDFFIRAQAATRGIPHLTQDRRRTKCFPDVDFEFV
jgi:predicted nucleic acid-binding protein